MPPLVSVVIPAHNGERYLPQAIESVLRQDYPRYDVWVVDNGSTDRTREAAARYPRVRYVYSQTADACLARNQGILLSAGEYVAFLDQDDTWAPRKLGRQVRFLETHPECGAAVSLQEIYLEEGCAKPRWLKQALLERPQPAYLPSALMARRSVLESTGNFDPAYSLASDVDWFFKARHEGIQVGLLEEVLIRRRIHDENASRRLRPLQAEILSVIQASLKKRREARG